MTHIFDAAMRVIALLRTIDEAQVAYDDKTESGGALRMPAMWHQGSYSELARCLRLLREGGPDQQLDPDTGKPRFDSMGFPVCIQRKPEWQLWWHAAHRYRYGTIHVEMVRVKRERLGPRLELPPRTELVAGGAVVGDRVALARLYRWSDAVDQGVASAGVHRLTELMFGGRDTRIQVPVSVLQRMLGQPAAEKVAC